jgi:hypothetical protein
MSGKTKPIKAPATPREELNLVRPETIVGKAPTAFKIMLNPLIES